VNAVAGEAADAVVVMTWVGSAGVVVDRVGCRGGHPPYVPLQLLPLNQRFKRGTAGAPQAFRSWQTCTPVPCLSPGLVI